jgi:hypothetical protein
LSRSPESRMLKIIICIMIWAGSYGTSPHRTDFLKTLNICAVQKGRVRGLSDKVKRISEILTWFFFQQFIIKFRVFRAWESSYQFITKMLFFFGVVYFPFNPIS